MGQFSTEIYIPPGSTLSGNQQLTVPHLHANEKRTLPPHG
jgi:hypothetical protein